MSPDSRQRARTYALLRVLTVTVVIAGIVVVDDPPWWMVATIGPLAAIYAGLVVHATRAAVDPPRPLVLSILDIALILVAMAGAGGPDTLPADALPFLAVSFVILHEPRRIAALTAAMIAAYLLTAIPFTGAPGAEELRAIGGTVVQTLLTGTVAVVLGIAFRGHAAEIRRLDDVRASLLIDALEAEERERAKIADRLHDDALQSILAAQQDLKEARAGYLQSLEYADEALTDSVRTLRETVRGIHPAVLAERGLAAALRSEVDRAARRGSFAVELVIDDDALGVQDDLVFALARELITNAAKHANASNLEVRVARQRDDVVLTVADDGVGLEQARAEAALAAGHVGLANTRQRARAAGGDLQVDAVPGRGTTIRAWLPGRTPTGAPAARDGEPARLAAVAAAVAIGARVPRDAFARLCRLGAVALEAPVVFVTLAGDGHHRLQGQVGLDEPFASADDLPPGRSAGDEVVATGRPLSTSDLRRDDRLGAVIEQRTLGLAACAIAPVCDDDGRIIGTLCAGDPKRRAWSGEALSALEALAQLAGRELARDALVARHQAHAEALDAERRFIAAVLESLDEGVIAVDEEGELRIANAAARRIAGPHPVQALEELAERGALARQTGDVAQTVEPGTLPLTRAVAGDRVAEELRVRDAAGERCLLVTGHPIADAEGARGAIMTMQDVTLRKRAERARQEADTLLSAAFEHVPVGMALAGLDGTLLSVNPRLCEITGHGAAAMAHMRYADLLTDTAEATVDVQAMADLVAGHTDVHEAERRMRHADGGVVWCRVRSRMVFAAGGDPSHVLLHIDDITERRAERERLRELVERDADTGLLDDRGLLRALRTRAATVARHGGSAGLVVIALDGPADGEDPDRVVRIAGALSDRVRDADEAARTDACEFAVMGHTVDAGGLQVMAASMLDNVLAVVAEEGAHRRLSPRVGIGAILVDGPIVDEDELLAHARAAAVAARGQGGGVVVHGAAHT